MKSFSQLMERKKLKAVLPPLAFGGRSAQIDDSISDMHKRIKLLMPGLKEYESIDAEGFFQHHSAFANVNGLNIVATSSTPVRGKLNKNESTTLIIPFSGSGDILVEDKVFPWQAGVNALLLPKCKGSSESSMRSLIMLDIDPTKLETTLSNMLGIDPNLSSPLNLNGPQSLKLQIGRLSFETIFRQIANLLDQFLLQPELVNKTILDENIYRNIALMMKPELFLDKPCSTLNKKYTRRMLDRVCDYIQTHLSEPISIATLERVSGTSARNLHYEFLKRYNTTPMRWVRTERLAMAHDLLSFATQDTTVTSIAFSCGFNKPASFAHFYFKLYGELPSSVLTRTLAR